jgi:hypothetical protein
MTDSAPRRKVPLGFALPWTPDMRRKLATVTADDILRARRLWWQVVRHPLHALLEAKAE